MSQLSKEQRRALEQYAEGAIPIEELRQRLRGVLEFDFRASERRLTCHFLLPEPGIRIELRHIRNAMDRHARGEITTEQLSDWAAMLLLNDAYEWEGPDAEEIAEWLNEISGLNLRPETRAE